MNTLPDINAIPSAARHRSLKVAVFRLSILLLLVPESRADPVTHSLGMEFLPAGTPNVLVSRWETRVQDFAAFVQTTGYDAVSESTDGKRPFALEADATNAAGYDWKQAGGSWQDPHFPQSPVHPATCLSCHDAVRFCAWLTRHEEDQGTLPKGWRYRLPTDDGAYVGLLGMHTLVCAKCSHVEFFVKMPPAMDQSQRSRSPERTRAGHVS